MKTTLFIICSIALFAWHRYTIKKIDKEEAEALVTPGEAVFLRNNFGAFIKNVLEDPNNYIIFERSDLIRFGKKEKNGYELIIGNMMEFKGPIMFVIIQHGNNVLSKWKFPIGADQIEISNLVLNRF